MAPRDVSALLGPEALAGIYEGTDVLLERNPAPSREIAYDSKHITQVRDPVVNHLYNNLKSTVEQIIAVEGNPKPEISDESLFSYINTHKFPTEGPNICDKSLKKSVDVLLNPLLRVITYTGRYTTTSCCSGRIVLFEKDSHFQDKRSVVYGRAGRILYSSHTHVAPSSVDEVLKSLDSNPKCKYSCYTGEGNEVEDETRDDSNPASSEDGGVIAENEVILKYEPFLIHVECNSIDDASQLLNASRSVGLKQSGITLSKKKIILAIRGNNILEAPIAIKKYKIEEGHLALLENKHLISDEYLILLINMANSKMTMNVYQFLRLYHRLRRPFKIDLGFKELDKNSSSPTHYGSRPKPEAVSAKDKYIDIAGSSRLLQTDRLSFPFGVEKPISILTFGEESNHLFRSHCMMASSKDFVVLLGGYEKSKTKTMCVCDLKNLHRGFKLVEIDANGPECLLDSSIISDGTVFITFGGRKNMTEFSNDVYVLYLQTDKGSPQASWFRCEVKGDLRPEKRFRHSICLESNKIIQSGDDSSPHTYLTRFFVSGGVGSGSSFDESIMGDIWLCSLTYSVKGGIIGATVEWERVYYDPSFVWCSGSLSYSPFHKSLFHIGGYTNLDNFLANDWTRMEELLKFDLEAKSFSTMKTNHAPTQFKTHTKDTLLPFSSISHSLVQIAAEEYFMVGGFGGLNFRDEIWYINLRNGVVHKSLELPPGTRAGFGASLVSFTHLGCKHLELWLIGGGLPIMVTYGSIYDSPLRIVLSCDNKCSQSTSFHCLERTDYILNKETYTDIGLFFVCQDKASVKELKTRCEQLLVFERSRKIVKIDPKTRYGFHDHSCMPNSNFTKCPEYGHTLACEVCGCCSGCKQTHFSELEACFLIPVSRPTSQISTSQFPLFRLFSTSTPRTNLVTQSPKEKLLSLLSDSSFEENIKTVSITGSAMLITLFRDEDVPHLDWEDVSKKLRVTSVALAGEIEGQKRRRSIRLLYGSGDVSVNENGVTYLFNIATNMFSKGNSAERIRIVKSYFGTHTDQVEPKKQKAEIVVDFFCGIGYFSIPIMKFTDSSRVSNLLCVDVNEAAISYLRANSEINGIERGRIDAVNANCSNFRITFGKDYENMAHRVLLGLLPSSEVGWVPALRALNKTEGGILHVHGLTIDKTPLEFEPVMTNECWRPCVTQVPYTEEQYEKDRMSEANCLHFSTYALRSFYELCRTLPFMKGSNWSLQVLHVQTVKHYSPHKYHQVVDLSITPIL